MTFKRPDDEFDQADMFGAPATFDQSWAMWQGMPEMTRTHQGPWWSIKVRLQAPDGECDPNIHVRDREGMMAVGEVLGVYVNRTIHELHVPCASIAQGLADFSRLMGQNVTPTTRALWYPEMEKVNHYGCRYVGDPAIKPQWPIYVPSKGRWESRLTVKALDRIGVDHRVVVEPQEFDAYAAVMDPARLLVLPFSDEGLHATRNWIWDHAASEGARWFWQIDDNIRRFLRWNHNIRTPVTTGAIFRAAEDFCDRFSNVAQGGFQYMMFAPPKEIRPPFYYNTRIYSCTLNRTDLPFRYRHRYNDDTDLSLQALKAGWCTVLFNAFLADKMQTMVVKGGNTPIYQDDGRLKMAEALRDLHPDVVVVGHKWGRAQHVVDYSGFRRNAFRLREELQSRDGTTFPEGPDEYGMTFERLIDGAWQRMDPAGMWTKSPVQATDDYLQAGDEDDGEHVTVESIADDVESIVDDDWEPIETPSGQYAMFGADA